MFSQRAGDFFGGVLVTVVQDSKPNRRAGLAQSVLLTLHEE